MRYSDPITVGIDGSSKALGALRWAAHAATIHQTTLDIVFAMETAAAPLIDYTVPEVYFDAARMYATAAVETAVQTVKAVSPDIELRTHVVVDSARSTLLSRSRSSSMVVVGATGTGRLTAALVGSVATALASHSVCPLAVIRDAGEQTRPTGRVTVGVDGSPESLEALDWAAHEATDRAAQLVVISAWNSSGFQQSDKAFAAAEREIESALAIPVNAVARRLPRLRVTTQVVDDAPVAALAKASEDSDLVIVGSRGRGGFTGLLLGSTSQGALFSTRCPLVIVP